MINMIDRIYKVETKGWTKTKLHWCAGKSWKETWCFRIDLVQCLSWKSSCTWWIEELWSTNKTKLYKINDTSPFIGFSPFTLWLGMGISKNSTAGYQALNFQMWFPDTNFWYIIYKSHPCLYLCSYLDLLNLIVLKSLNISHSNYPQISPTKTAKQRSSSGTVLGRIILRRPEFRWPCKGEISGDGPKVATGGFSVTTKWLLICPRSQLNIGWLENTPLWMVFTQEKMGTFNGELFVYRSCKVFGCFTWLVSMALSKSCRTHHILSYTQRLAD